MLPRPIVALIAVLAAAACSTPEPAPEPNAAKPQVTPQPAPWRAVQPQLRAWEATHEGTDLLTGLEGLIALERLFARLYPGDYDAFAIAYRKYYAVIWIMQLDNVAAVLPQTTATFVDEIRKEVWSNSNQTSGPATLEAGMAPLQMRGRLAFCDGFVSVAHANPAHPEDVFLTSWERVRWVAELYEANPNGVPQDLLFGGLWEAREQWLQLQATEPYEEIRHDWGHLLSEALHQPLVRSSPLFRTLELVAILRRHQLSRFRVPAPLTDEFVDLLATIQELATSDNPHTASAGADAWWYAKRGIDVVWNREDDPVRRVLLGAMRDECIDACQSLSPTWERVDAGVIRSAQNWQQILRIASEFEASRGAPLHSRIHQLEQLLPRSEELGRPFLAVLRHVSKPLQRKLENEAHALHADGCTALASMRWLEAQQLFEPETLRLESPVTPFGDIRQQLIQHLPSVDRDWAYYGAFQDFLGTQMLGRSRLASMYGIRLRRTDSPNTGARARPMRAKQTRMRWAAIEEWNQEGKHPLPVPTVQSEQLTELSRVLTNAEANYPSTRATNNAQLVSENKAAFATALEQHDNLHREVLRELWLTCQLYLGSPTSDFVEASIRDANLPPRERAARRWLLGLEAQPPQRLKPRPQHRATLAQLVLDCSDAATAAKHIRDQLELRSRTAAAGSQDALAHHLTRLQPAWAAYAKLYGLRAMHDRLLTPLFANNREALQIVVNCVPEPRRELLRQRLKL